MKKLILLLLAVLPLACFSQTDTTNFTWTYINKCVGTKHQLYLKARDWAFKLLENPKAAIQINDSASGKILIHTDFPTITSKYNGTIYCDLEVDLKDDKYRFRAYNYYVSIEYYGSPYNVSQDQKFTITSKDFPFKIPFKRKEKSDAVWVQIKEDARSQTAVIYDLLKTEMDKKQESNW